LLHRGTAAPLNLDCVDAAGWAQVISPVASACVVVATVGWAVAERRRADDRANEDRYEAYQKSEQDRHQAEKLASATREANLLVQIAVSFERHQAGDAIAAGECRALLLAVGRRLPVTRLLYLGIAGWRPEDNPRIEELAGFYELPVSVELARHELRHELQGTQFTLFSENGAGDTDLSSLVPFGNGHRELLLRVRKPGKHIRR
jgi:hypothetical protein